MLATTRGAMLLWLLATRATTQAYSVRPAVTSVVTVHSSSSVDRRTAFANVLATAGVLLSSSPAFASGGATAGKYTTIPIAKR
jgi:hypothetical protein